VIGSTVVSRRKTSLDSSVSISLQHEYCVNQAIDRKRVRAFDVSSRAAGRIQWKGCNGVATHPSSGVEDR